MPDQCVAVGLVDGFTGCTDHKTSFLTLIELYAVPAVVTELRGDPQPKVTIDTEVTPVVQAVHVRAKQQPVGDGMLTSLCEWPYMSSLQAREGCTRCDSTPVLIRDRTDR